MSGDIGFEDLPLEMQEYILSFVPADNCINTAKVSSKWLDLTLSTIKEIQPCHSYAVNDLAEFVNQQRQTNYDGVSLLSLMPRLEKLELIEHHKNIYEKLIPVLSKLKVLRIDSKIQEMIDFKKLNVQFEKLIEFTYDGGQLIFPLSILEIAPKLRILTIQRLYITQAWHKKIPKTVTQFTVKSGFIENGGQAPIEFLFQNQSTLEKFELIAAAADIAFDLRLEDYSKVPSLKTLTLDVDLTSDARNLRNAFGACHRLQKVKTFRIFVTSDWYRTIPPNILSISLQYLEVTNDLQEEFSFEYLFQNHHRLQELDIVYFDWKGLNPEKLRCGRDMRKLHMGNKWRTELSLAHFSTVCLKMVRSSSLVDVAFTDLEIDNAWKNALPATVEHLSLKNCWVNKEAIDVFSPQFLCTTPSNIKTLVMHFKYVNNHLRAMDINSFQGMSRLTTLSIDNWSMSSECLKSVLINCTSLVALEVQGFADEASTDVARGLISLSLKSVKFHQHGWNRYQ